MGGAHIKIENLLFTKFSSFVTEDILPWLHDEWLLQVLSCCGEITWKEKIDMSPDHLIPSDSSHGSLLYVGIKRIY